MKKTTWLRRRPRSTGGISVEAGELKIFFTKFLLLIAFVTKTLVAAPSDQKMQKQQLESLLKAILPFGEMVLKNHGEFIPYGGTIGIDGKIKDVAGYTGNEHPKSMEVIKLLKDSFRH